MSTHQKLSWTAVGLCSVAAILQPLTPEWVALALITPALLLMVVGMVLIQREVHDIDEALALQDKWRAERERWS
jgi:hypothetical protein